MKGQTPKKPTITVDDMYAVWNKSPKDICSGNNIASPYAILAQRLTQYSAGSRRGGGGGGSCRPP